MLGRTGASPLDALLGIDGEQADSARPRAPEFRAPVTIERTSKQYKLGMVIGKGFMLVALGMTGFSLYAFVQNHGRYPVAVSEFLSDQPSVYVAVAGFVIGFLVYRVEVFLAWWNNG